MTDNRNALIPTKPPMNILPADLLRLCGDENGLVIPLAQNRNDKGTLFAGSIYAGAVLAGYRLAQRLMEEQALRGELVAESATIEYRAPIRSDGTARAEAVTELTPTPSGNHDLRVRVEVVDAAGTQAATAQIRYVLLTDAGC